MGKSMKVSKLFTKIRTFDNIYNFKEIYNNFKQFKSDNNDSQLANNDKSLILNQYYDLENSENYLSIIASILTFFKNNFDNICNPYITRK